MRNDELALTDPALSAVVAMDRETADLMGEILRGDTEVA